MNTRHCLNIANRIHCLLQAELDQGVDAERMVADRLYARDVLLVCEGFGSGELPQLAQQFRSAALAPSQDASAAAPSRAAPAAPAVPAKAAAPTRPAPEAGRAGRISGFFNSIFAPSTLPPSTIEPPPVRPAARRASGRPGGPGR